MQNVVKMLLKFDNILEQCMLDLFEGNRESTQSQVAGGELAAPADRPRPREDVAEAPLPQAAWLVVAHLL